MDNGVSLKGVGTKGPYQVDKATQTMSVKHHKDTVEYNLRHAEEHLKAAREACDQLKQGGDSTPPPVSKQLLSHVDYFKEAVKEPSPAEAADKKLKSHIKANY